MTKAETNEATYGKLLDLFDLALDLQQNAEGLSLADIQEKYACSRRTAVRMKDALLRAFPQMEEVPAGSHVKRWRIAQRGLNSLISFSGEDFSALETAKQALIRQNLGDKAEALERMTVKLKNLMAVRDKNRTEVDAEELMKAEGIAWRPGPRIKAGEGVLSALRQAILSCRRVRIVYDKFGKTETRDLKPYGFLYGERNHYLIAENQNGEMRNFILTRIQSVEILEKSFVFDLDFSLKKYAERSFGAYQEKPFEVEWLFSEKAARAASAFVFHPTQTATRNDDGTLTVKFKAGGLLEMAWHLKTWGDNVTVVRPADFWERAEKAQKEFENCMT